MIYFSFFFFLSFIFETLSPSLISALNSCYCRVLSLFLCTIPLLSPLSHGTARCHCPCLPVLTFICPVIGTVFNDRIFATSTQSILLPPPALVLLQTVYSITNYRNTTTYTYTNTINNTTTTTIIIRHTTLYSNNYMLFPFFSLSEDMTND